MADLSQLSSPATATGTSCHSSPEAVMHDIPLVSVITMVQVPCGDIKISMTAVEFTTPMTRRVSLNLLPRASAILSWLLAGGRPRQCLQCRPAKSQLTPPRGSKNGSGQTSWFSIFAITACCSGSKMAALRFPKYDLGHIRPDIRNHSPVYFGSAATTLKPSAEFFGQRSA